MRVRAKTAGYFGKLREPGDEFDITGEHELGLWMEAVKPAKPAKKTTADPEGNDSGDTI